MVILGGFWGKLRVLATWKQLQTLIQVRPHQGITSIKISEKLHYGKGGKFIDKMPIFRQKVYSTV